MFAFKSTGRERTNEFTRAISHNNHYTNKLSIIYDDTSISPTNRMLKSRNNHI